MIKAAATTIAAFLLLPVLMLSAGIAVSTGASATNTPAASQTALTSIPGDYLLLYQQAATRCPGLPWPLLAAIGKVETDHGQGGQTSPAGALGPMQFLPSTWNSYGVDGDGDGQKNIFDPADAIPAAADYLCATGARNGADLSAAVYAYNHDTAYVAQVFTIAATYTAPTNPDTSSASSAPPAAITSNSSTAQVLAFARSQLGVPYLWGGTGPGGFDCSGLTQAAFAAARIPLPRTAQAQYDATPHLPVGASPAAGDLLFFGTSTATITHVGIALGDGQMIDAPHTGAVVRIEPDNWSDYLGATRPITPPAGTGPSW